MELVLGAVVSILVQWLKNEFATSEYKTLAVLLFVSLLAAGMYTYLVAIGYWQTVAAVLLTAGAFYSFVLQRFEN